jgi:diguanylate cyclase (GGDEF)-like protein
VSVTTHYYSDRVLSQPPARRSETVDDLVALVATELMAATSATLHGISGQVLRSMVEFFGVDLSFLRFHDTARRATVLVAEWPPRPVVPDPDPLGVIFFDTADPAFAASEHLTDIMVIRPTVGSASYQQRVQDASGVTSTSVATVPLRSGQVTTGAFGFIKFGDRGWDDAEIRALRTIATLLAQVQARLVADDQLLYLAHHDELTGLLNRRALLAHLESVLEADPPEPRALLFLDVDRLKALNDLMGHAAGDLFISSTAQRLRSVVAAGDVLARLGGDEFVLALTGPSTAERAGAVAARLQEALAEPMVLGGQVLRRTVSIGIALSRSPHATVADWLRDADQAVLAAKIRGGNVAVAFTEEMREDADLRNAIEVGLSTAIQTRRLTLHYQPVIDLNTHRIVGAEALVRWNHPTLGPISPEVFVRVAEATNQAGELGQWVLDQACQQLAEWRRALPHSDVMSHLGIAVNISPVQLIAVDFVDTVAAALSRHGLAGADLTLEVTEHAVVGDEGTSHATLRALRELGVIIAIDDFGTGYSSLAQLKALPVTVLKIDQGFVRDLGTNTNDLVIVRAITALATSFGLELIAEGVETPAAAATLLALGCTRAQGFLFHKPLPPEQILSLLTDDPATLHSPNRPHHRAASTKHPPTETPHVLT